MLRFVLALVLLDGCAVGGPVLIHVDKSDAPAAADSALHVVVAYFQACGEAVDVGPDFAVRFGSTDEERLGEYTVGDDHVTLSASLNWRGDDDACGGPLAGAGPAFYISRVMAHEVGHLIGYHHVPNTEALMYYGISPCEQLPANCPRDF